MKTTIGTALACTIGLELIVAYAPRAKAELAIGRFEIVFVHPGNVVRPRDPMEWTYDTKSDCEIAIKTVRVKDGARLKCEPVTPREVRR